MMTKPEWFGLADKDQAVRASFASVAVWWVVFTIPLLRSVPEPPVTIGDPDRLASGGRPDLFRSGIIALWHTVTELRRYRNAFLLLLAFLIYNDGVQTIIRMATIYGTEIGLDDNAMIAALAVTQFIGIPFAFLFGMLAGRVGAKPAIFGGLAVYALISVLGYFMRTSAEFFALAVMVGMVQGGTQALSRSLFASMIPKEKSSEFFAFFGVFERYASVLGPAVFAWVVSHSGTSRNAILSVLAFFVVGGALLSFVDVDEGRAAVRQG